MTLQEYILQSEYCRKNNTPEGAGCDNCPALDKDHCADALLNLCDKWLKTTGEKREEISRVLDIHYGISPYSQLRLISGILELKGG